jgi:hypothetical protein
MDRGGMWTGFARLVMAIALIGAPLGARAIEEPHYEVQADHGDVEIRRYAPYLVAGVRVEAPMEGAGNAAFRRLFRYISGDNATQQKIAMTAPVTLTGEARGWTVTFAMPATFDAATLPSPTNPDVRILAMPAETVAALRYGGGWKEERDRERESTLRARLDALGLTACGPARFARYNSPFSLPVMRRNEVLIPVAEDACPTPG